MVLEPLAIQVFGAITARTVPVVLDFLGNRLKTVLEGKRGRGKNEVETFRREVERLRQQVETKVTIGESEIKQVEAQIEKARIIQQRYGFELISNQAHKQWVLKQFEELGKTMGFAGSFKINLWTQEGTTSIPRDISIVPVATPGSYGIGDKVTFFFRSNHACYLTLFNLGTSGAVTILFPNRLFPDNFIEADRIYSIPGAGYNFEYVLSGPSGVERIRAIASMEKVNLADLDFSQKDKFFYFAERSTAAKDIQIAEKRIKEQPSTGWAIATCEFVVR